MAADFSSITNVVIKAHFKSAIKLLWFRSAAERKWFTLQVNMHYANCRKLIVLFALRRLAEIFECPIFSLEYNVVWEDLLDDSMNQSQNNYLSGLLPQELQKQPLQIIADDYVCAKDFLERTSIIKRLSLTNTVGDYVKFLIEYDKYCRFVYQKSAINMLGFYHQ